MFPPAPFVLIFGYRNRSAFESCTNIFPQSHTIVERNHLALMKCCPLGIITSILDEKSSREERERTSSWVHGASDQPRSISRVFDSLPVAPSRPDDMRDVRSFVCTDCGQFRHFSFGHFRQWKNLFISHGLFRLPVAVIPYTKSIEANSFLFAI